MIPVTMPQVGHDIPTATIIKWLKKENDPVEKGEVILIVESDKAAFEVEAEASGFLLKILHQEGEEVEVFKPVAYIDQPNEVCEHEIVVSTKDEAAAQVCPPKSEKEDMRGIFRTESRPFASPAASRVARELGIDIKSVKGSGPHNRITKRDVLAAALAASGPAKISRPDDAEQILSGDTVILFDRTRKRIADRLTLSKRTIPHFYLLLDVDMSDALKWRTEVNQKRGTNITITDMIIKASALALAKFDHMNAHVDSEKIMIKKDIHIGVATSVESTILVPVIANPDKRGLIEISEISKKNTASAHRGFLISDCEATFTISTLGMHSISRFFPIINPPECAILGVGAVEPRVVPLAGGIGVRSLLTLTLACDHRAADGVYAARFLNQIKKHLENVFADVEGSVL